MRAASFPRSSGNRYRSRTAAARERGLADRDRVVGSARHHRGGVWLGAARQAALSGIFQRGKKCRKYWQQCRINSDSDFPAGQKFRLTPPGLARNAERPGRTNDEAMEAEFDQKVIGPFAGASGESWTPCRACRATVTYSSCRLLIYPPGYSWATDHQNSAPGPRLHRTDRGPRASAGNGPR
jgi:hypothetical protein